MRCFSLTVFYGLGVWTQVLHAVLGRLPDHQNHRRRNGTGTYYLYSTVWHWPLLVLAVWLMICCFPRPFPVLLIVVTFWLMTTQSCEYRSVPLFVLMSRRMLVSSDPHMYIVSDRKQKWFQFFIFGNRDKHSSITNYLRKNIVISENEIPHEMKLNEIWFLYSSHRFSRNY